MAQDRFELTTTLWLPQPREQVFAFFADAHNLERITPPLIGFEVLNGHPIEMRRGALIDYRLKLHGVPLRWKTEITHWDPPVAFTDTQLRGPYSEWVHTHTFEEQDGGTLIRDRVVYRLPGPGPIARLVNRWLVARDVRAIFTYRHEALCEAFGGGARARKGPVEMRAVTTSTHQ
jgi:ligand-binding SRPBCC domain-containing protein